MIGRGRLISKPSPLRLIRLLKRVGALLSWQVRLPKDSDWLNKAALVRKPAVDRGAPTGEKDSSTAAAEDEQIVQDSDEN